MTPDDPSSADLAQIHAAAFTDQRPWSAAEFADLLARPQVFVVSDTAGFALGQIILDEVELLTLAIAPDHQGQGHGRRMLEAYHQEAVQRGGLSSFLEVAESNGKAIRLYETAGYAHLAKRERYYRLTDGQQAAACVMKRDLNC